MLGSRAETRLPAFPPPVICCQRRGTGRKSEQDMAQWNEPSLETIRQMRSFFTTIVLLATLCTAMAQGTVEREVKGQSGQDIRVGVYANIQPDCSAGPLPTIRLVTSPQHGKITIKKGRLNATNVKHCLALEVPAYVAIYRSPADFEGTDAAVIEIKSAQGNIQVQRLTIQVSKKSSARGI
jgi:hypothetical protein